MNKVKLMTIKDFMKAAHLSPRKRDWEGYSWTCIYRAFESSAELGYEQGYLTEKQRDILIERGRDRADSFSY